MQPAKVAQIKKPVPPKIKQHVVARPKKPAPAPATRKEAKLKSQKFMLPGVPSPNVKTVKTVHLRGERVPVALKRRNAAIAIGVRNRGD